MKNVDIKRFVIMALLYVLFFWLADKCGQAFRLSLGADISAKIINLQGGFAAAFVNPLPSFHPQDLIVGVIGAAIVALMLQSKKANTKKYRKGMEYGSARFGTAKDIAPFIDPDPDRNVILTQTAQLTMNNRPKNPAHARNKNVLVIGGSGSGKTRFFIKPNLMQMHSSYVVTDPNGLL
jgi:type IV secretion system protein VirD4